VEQSPAGGLTLASNPVSNWAGSIGVQSPEEKAAFAKGQDWEKMASTGGDVLKALQNKPSGAEANAATQLTPMTSQPNVPNAMAGELMAQLLKSKLKPRGVTLTG
jgi:hypothetical protein